MNDRSCWRSSGFPATTATIPVLTKKSLGEIATGSRLMTPARAT
jgi:hypothetical protein